MEKYHATVSHSATSKPVLQAFTPKQKSDHNLHNTLTQLKHPLALCASCSITSQRIPRSLYPVVCIYYATHVVLVHDNNTWKQQTRARASLLYINATKNLQTLLCRRKLSSALQLHRPLPYRSQKKISEMAKPEAPTKKYVLVLYTGGTIGMIPDASGERFDLAILQF